MTDSTTLLRLTGRDALAVLHRIATQKLDDLAPGEARATCFCDFRGRLLHRAAVAMTRDHTAWLLRADAPGEPLAEFIERHVFREDVKIDVRADAAIHVRYDVQPDDAGVGLATERDGRPHELRVSAHESLTVAAPGTTPAPNERLRIRAFGVRDRHEVHEDFTPFEIGLAREVHLSKGCFTGQEALLRLVTYESVRRQLVRLDGDGAPPAPRARVTHAGEPVGVVTSVTADGGGFAALAVVKRTVVEARSLLAIEGVAAPATVHAAPLERPLGVA